MNLFKRSRGLWVAGLMAVAVSASLPSVAHAKPVPGVQRGRGFRVFARTLGAMVVNRVYLGLNAARGEIGVDSTNSSTIGGGYWPKGTPNQYVFNSGLQVAGIVSSSAPGFEWNGDKTGAFFFDARGNLAHGSQIEPVWNSRDPNDLASWPEGARVPNERTPEQQLFNPLLRGRKNASQGDVWFVNWDGDPTLSSGRPHPLGVMVETRGLGWNYPSGNEDIVYFTFTFYNVTASDPAAYNNIRPEMQPYAIAAGADFQRRNEASYSISIPDGGYTLDSLFAAFAADMDVANAGSNFCSVNLPFALGYCYEHTFTQEPGWQFDPGIFGAPFFAGTGFVGVKYLRSPTGPGEINLFSNTVNSTTAFRDPQDVFALYRYLSGNVDQAIDGSCNQGNPRITRICFINPTNADARFYQSSTPLRLAPGEFGSIVVAYIFAAPVALTGFAPTASTDVRPENPLRLVDPNLLTTSGANRIDSLTGYAGFAQINDPKYDPLKAEQNEFKTVPGSLLGKSLVAQAVFDNSFLLPFSPEAPNFYLVPGNNQVTVLWQKSASETTGDPFFEIANNPGIPGEPNPLYDPNYRQFDVEGYRLYRGRVDNSEALTLVAQFDYAGTTILDYTSQINPVATCAVELDVTTDCPVDYDFVLDGGVPATVANEIPLVGDIVQIKLKTPSRVKLANGEALVVVSDTALVSSANGSYPALSDNGVPFAYIDRDVKNNFRYFYSVTAFDVNSIQSGPSSLESPRITKAITPTVDASNQVTAQLTFGLVGENGPLPTGETLTIDANTGRFIGPIPPTDGVAAAFAPLVPVLLPALNITASIDSVEAYYTGNPKCNGVANGFDTCYIYYTSLSDGGAPVTAVSVEPHPVWDAFDGVADILATFGNLPVTVDQAAAQRYGVPDSTKSFASVTADLYQYIEYSSFEGQMARRNLHTNNGSGASACQGLGGPTNCAAASSVGGSRWFAGADETIDHPTVGIRVGGGLPGVDSVWAPIHHVDPTPANGTVNSPANSGTIQWFGYGFAGLGRQADVSVVWGQGGTVTVRDLTHDVPVRFSQNAFASYGFVTDANGDGVIRWNDFSFIPNVGEFWIAEGLGLGPASPAAFRPLVNTATVLPVSTAFSTTPAADGQGIGLYINGERYIFKLTGGQLPPPGTEWKLRTYSGVVRSSSATAFSNTPASYSVRTIPASPAIPGLKVKFNVPAATTTVAVTNTDLARVHTVPDPYYVTNQYEQTTENKILKFVNLPNQCIIRIYSASGILVTVLEHNSTTNSGEETWNLRNRNNQVVASGVYFYHLESGDARRVGRFTVVNFAQ